MYRVFMQDFISAARDNGIGKLNFYVEQKHFRSVSVFQGELERMDRAELTQMYIEGEYQGMSGGVFVENFDPALIPQHIQGIQEAALCGKTPFVPYALESGMEQNGDRYHPLNLQEVIDRMCQADKLACSLDSRILPVGQCHMKEESFRYVLADEAGNQVSDYLTGGGVHISVVAREGEDAQSSHQSAPIHGGQLPDLEALARGAAKEAVSLIGGTSYATGECPVVLESRVVCELLDAFMPTFFAKSVDNRMSVLAEKLGQKVAGENIFLTEDPFLENGLRCRRVDDEGVATGCKEIVSAGVLNTYLHNRQTAEKYDCVSGGNGFKQSVSEPVSTGYTNVVLRSGTATLAELAEEMGNGLLITDVNGVFAGAHPVSGEFSLIAKGYRVDDGVIGQSVKQITIAGNFFDMLSNVVRIAGDEYRMRMTLGCVCAPSLFVRSLMVSGKE